MSTYAALLQSFSGEKNVVDFWRDILYPLISHLCMSYREKSVHLMLGLPTSKGFQGNPTPSLLCKATNPHNNQKDL